MPQLRWIDPNKLIHAAQDLAAHHSGPGRPKHTLLRRSVSTAYYALYHHLCLEGARVLLPQANQAMQLAFVRGFGHAEIKDCCGWIAGRKGGVSPPVKPIVALLGQSPFVAVSDTFWDLQEARHQADYDHLAAFSKASALASVADARRAMADVSAAAADVRQAFFVLVAMRARLPK